MRERRVAAPSPASFILFVLTSDSLFQVFVVDACGELLEHIAGQSRQHVDGSHLGDDRLDVSGRPVLRPATTHKNILENWFRTRKKTRDASYGAGKGRQTNERRRMQIWGLRREVLLGEWREKCFPSTYIHTAYNIVCCLHVTSSSTHTKTLTQSIEKLFQRELKRCGHWHQNVIINIAGYVLYCSWLNIFCWLPYFRWSVYTRQVWWWDFGVIFFTNYDSFNIDNLWN